MLKEVFKKLNDIFKAHGFSLYAVGGTVRDYLLGVPTSDFDFVSDATPSDMKEFLDADFTFEKYGTVKYLIDGVKVDIVTLRKEDSYLDKRHPTQIKFIKDLYQDSCRRDFTINALYMDINDKIYDYWNGEKDLKEGIIRCINDPRIRLSEDPLRILRALRFASLLNFKIEDCLNQAILTQLPDIKSLNKSKVKEEINKFKDRTILKKYKVDQYLDEDMFDL